MWRFAVFLPAVALVPASAHSQCVRMLGTNQIVCSGYANSTPPVYSGGGYYLPGRGMLGAGQMVYGGAMAGFNAYRRNPQPLPYNAGAIANGWYNMRNYPFYSYHPRIAVPTPRPYGKPW